MIGHFLSKYLAYKNFLMSVIFFQNISMIHFINFMMTIVKFLMMKEPAYFYYNNNLQQIQIIIFHCTLLVYYKKVVEMIMFAIKMMRFYTIYE